MTIEHRPLVNLTCHECEGIVISRVVISPTVAVCRPCIKGIYNAYKVLTGED